ncbi:MAG: 6,7-dimethyl-8-ribityllumazine synthase [Mesorhizobium amorphae]|nr:MAG: 6,7-dimethyl-8-ribityllumazine synthase [Mesorhizobium amorphae]
MPNTQSPHLLIVEARFYDDLSDALLAGAHAALAEAGASADVISVPGALEIPAVIAMAAAGTKHYDGYVALGCVIRGETYHFDVVSNESSRGLMELSIRHLLAIGNGILTTENEEQAWVRAQISDDEASDKGGGAARAALRMIEVSRELSA